MFRKDEDMNHPSLDEIIYRRRSIRKYSENIPPEEWIQIIIGAAMRAPSPSNTQPVRFVRLRSPEMREKLFQSLKEGKERLIQGALERGGGKKAKNWISYYYRYSVFMFDAPVLFAVGTIRDHVSFPEKLKRAGIIPSPHQQQKDLDITVGLTLSGYILKAEEYGLGTCILTAPLMFIENPERILSLEDIEIKCFLTTGYPGESPPLSPRKHLSEVYREV